MQTFLEAYKAGAVKLAPSNGSRSDYNAVDHPDHFRGLNHKKERTSARIYAVHALDGDFALCNSWDIFGKLYQERLPASTLVPWSENNER